MKRNLRIILSILLCSSLTIANAQVLKVELVQQSQTKWCWAAVSACILNYYKKDQSQCAIAEFARTQRSDYYGETDCCVIPRPKKDSCNKYNGLYGRKESIDAILFNFGNIKSEGQDSCLTKTNIATELQNNRLFVIRWGWKPDLTAGHFLVGYGLKDDDVYYMDPWEGEGFRISKYDYVVDSTNRRWTHSLVLQSNSGLPESYSTRQQPFYPNPSSGKISFRDGFNFQRTMIEISGSSGSLCYRKPFPVSGRLDLSGLPKGLYILRIITTDKSITTKLILQ